MVGLSVVLEGSISSTTTSCSNTSSQVLNKASMIIKTSPTSPTPSSPNPFSRRDSSLGFLDHCFLCKEKLLPTKDIYMYKGDRGFCSEECRWRQMYMDEEKSKSKSKKPKTKNRDNNCSLVASSPQLGSPSSSRSQKGGSKRSNGFVY